MPGRAARAGRRAAIPPPPRALPAAPVHRRPLPEAATAWPSILTTSSSPAAPSRVAGSAGQGAGGERGQDLIIEEPGCLGAIQAFSVYQPNFKPITLGKGWIWPRWMRCWSRAPAPGAALRRAQTRGQGGVSWPPAGKPGGRLVRHDLLMVETTLRRAALRGNTSLPSPTGPTTPCCSGSLLQDGGARLPPGLDGGAGLAAQRRSPSPSGAADLHSNAWLQPAGAAPLPDRQLPRRSPGDQGVMVASVPPWKPPSPATVRPASATPVPRGMFLWLTLPPSVSAMACSTRPSRRRWPSCPAPLLCAPGSRIPCA